MTLGSVLLQTGLLFLATLVERLQLLVKMVLPFGRGLSLLLGLVDGGSKGRDVGLDGFDGGSSGVALAVVGCGMSGRRLQLRQSSLLLRDRRPGGLQRCERVFDGVVKGCTHFWDHNFDRIYRRSTLLKVYPLLCKCSFALPCASELCGDRRLAGHRLVESFAEGTKVGRGLG